MNAGPRQPNNAFIGELKGYILLKTGINRLIYHVQGPTVNEALHE